MSWSARFDVPVKLPDGKIAYTLADARRFLLTVPNDKSNQPLQTALETLLAAAAKRGPVMHAGVGLAQFVRVGPPPIPESRPSKEKHWGKRKLKRDL